MRERMVTRTIVTTKATVLCANALTAEMFEQDVTLPRTYKDNKALMKAISAVIDKDTDDEKIKAIMVKDSSEVETLYGMSELEFIQIAKVLPPRGTKAE